MFTGHARKLLPSMLFSFIKTFGFIFFAILLSVSAGEHPKIFAGGVDGVFGWLGAEYVQQMLLFGFLVGIFGSFAWNFCLKHIDPLVFSTVELVEPVLTGVIAFAMGLEGLISICIIACNIDSFLAMHLFLIIVLIRHSESLDFDRRRCHSNRWRVCCHQ